MEIESQQYSMDGISISAMIKFKKHNFDRKFADMGIFWNSRQNSPFS